MMALYPVAAYISLWLKQPLLIIGYLVILLSLINVKKAIQQQWLTAGILFICIAAIFYTIQQSYTHYLVYFPPILVFFSLFILFSQSLLAEEIPLISRYAKLLGDNLDELHLRYYKILTILWSVFFLLMTITSILLAAFSSLDTWSLFTHVISYCLVAGFFLAEFLYRKKYFAGEVEGGFFHFMRKISKIRPHTLSK